MVQIWKDPNTYASSDVAIGDDVTISDHNTVREDIVRNTKIPQRFGYCSDMDYNVEASSGGVFIGNHQMVVGAYHNSTYFNFLYENPYKGTSTSDKINHDYPSFDGRTIAGIEVRGYAVIGYYAYVMIVLDDDDSADFNYIVEKYDLRDDTHVATMYESGWSTGWMQYASMMSDGTYLYINYDGSTDDTKINYIKKYSIGASTLTYVETYTMPLTHTKDGFVMDLRRTSAVLNDTYIICGYWVSGKGGVFVFDTSGSLVLDPVISSYTLCNKVFEGYPYLQGTTNDSWYRHALGDYLENL